MFIVDVLDLVDVPISGKNHQDEISLPSGIGDAPSGNRNVLSSFDFNVPISMPSDGIKVLFRRAKRTMTERVLVVDLETTGLFQSKNQTRFPEITLIVAFQLPEMRLNVFRCGERKEVLKFLMFSRDYLVGFNIRRFDLPLLSWYLREDVVNFPNLDLLDVIELSLGHSLPLTSLTKATLGIEKLASGKKAIEWHRLGDWTQLMRYAIHESLLMAGVYLHGLFHGFIRVQVNGTGRIIKIPVDW